MLQRRHSAVDLTEIGDFGHAPKFVGSNLMHRREDRRHGIVDPNIDRTKLVLDARRRGIDRFRVGDIDRNPERVDAESLCFCGCISKPLFSASQKGDAGSVFGEFDSQRTANACPGPGYDYGLRHADSLIVP